MKHLLTFLAFWITGCLSISFSQLPLGADAPNFILTDIETIQHNLFMDYLDQGKMAVVEFSATWCGPCWNYMQTGALEQFWEEHGPLGDQTAEVFYIEADLSTGLNDLLGLTPSSQGDWVAAIPFPIIDLTTSETSDNYWINYYPTLYAVCPDKTVWELGQVSASTWSAFRTSCTLAGEVEEVQPAACYGEGGVTLNYTGGNDPVTFEWSNGDEGPNLENVGAGTYSVTITENFGKFVVIENIVVPGADSPVTLEDSEIEEPLCNGASNGNIFVEFEGGSPGYTYDWSNGDNGQDLTDVPAGDYSVIVTDENGCTTEEEFSINEPDQIEVEIETTTENCDQEDGTATLTISGGVGNFDITASSGNVFGNQILDLAAGNVEVLVEDGNGCAWESEFDIEFLPAPEVEIGQGVELNCLQTTTTLTGFASSGSGDFEYFWSTTDGNIVSGVNNQTITIDEPGTYNLVVTDFNSQCEVESSMAVSAIIDLPGVSAGSDFPINCENNQPTIQGSGDAENSVNWTTPDGNIVSGGDTYTPVIDAAGTYYINVENSATGCSNVDTVIVNNDLDPANALYQYTTAGLTMITTDLSTGSGLSGWSWTFGDGNSSNANSPVHTYAAAGIYEVCLSVQNGCGSSTTCSTVEVTSVGSVLNVSAEVSNVLCFDGATGAISLVVNGGSGNYTYVWVGPGGSSYDTPSIDSLIAGAYVVVISDDQGNTFTGGYNVDQPQPIAIGASTVTDNLCFGQTNGSILVDMTGGVGPYLYSWNGGPQQPESFYGQLPGGNYEVLVTDANGCTLLVGPYFINEPPAIIALSVEVTDVLCHGDATGAANLIIAGGVAPYSYQWLGSGNTEPSFSGVPAGTYTLVVTDANVCQQNIDVVIDEPAAIAVNVTEVKNATNTESNNGSITIQVDGGTAPYLITWDNGASGSTINNLAPGAYTYTVVDAHGCTLVSSPIVVSTSVGTTEVDGSLYVAITPNPSDGRVVVKWKELANADASLTLMTLDGRKMGSFTISSPEGVWDLTDKNLSEGLYIVLLTQGEYRFPFKLVVMN